MLIGLIDYTLLGNFIRGTAPISAQVWLFIMPFGVVLLALEELRKWLVLGSTIIRALDPAVPANDE